ncbi:MAG: amino acid ABC transporter permease [Pseudoflavonifractor sp.]
MSFGAVTLTLLKAFSVNIEIFAITLVLSLPLGLVAAFGSMSRFKPLSWLTRGLVYIIRGTPLMLQIMIIYYAPGLIFGVPLPNRTFAAIAAIVVNYTFYFSEIYRGGILGVPMGQSEAGQVLGMTKRQIFFKVTLLQVVRRIVPPIGNEIITLVKDTSLAYIIMVKDIIGMAKEFGAMGLIWPLFYTGVFFLIFNGVVTLLLSHAEKKLDYFKV